MSESPHESDVLNGSRYLYFSLVMYLGFLCFLNRLPNQSSSFSFAVEAQILAGNSHSVLLRLLLNHHVFFYGYCIHLGFVKYIYLEGREREGGRNGERERETSSIL